MKLRDRIKAIFHRKPPVTGGGSAATIGSEPAPPKPPEKPTATEVEEKDERENCPKCGYFRDLPLRDKWSKTEYRKDATGERLSITCWMCGYQYTQECWDAEAQNAAGERQPPAQPQG